MNSKLNFAKLQKNYNIIINYLISKTFRVPMKQFIDKHCDKFENKLESSHEQFQLHEQFKTLVENLLNAVLEDAQINETEFMEVAKIGLERETDKAYFEQVISCDNFQWFKHCMIKRNLQLKEQSMKLMYANKGDLKLGADSTINKMMKDKEQAELECAIAMSLAADDYKKKLYTEEKSYDGIAVSLSLLLFF